MLPFTVRLDRSEAGCLASTSNCDDTSPPMGTGFFTQSRIYSLGYSHLASAVMAMKHFNERDGRITPEVEQLGDCNIQFGHEGTTVLDTGTIGNLGNALLSKVHLQRDYPICGIAGPYYDNPARNVAVLAAAGQTPQIPYRGYSISLTMNNLSPMTTMVTPDQLLVAQALVSYLIRIGRDDFISFLHPLTDLGVQQGLVQEVVFNQFDIHQFSIFGYISEFVQMTLEVDRSIPTQMKKVKERGFRTIVVTLDAFIMDLPAIADAAEALNMLNGDYVWIFIPVFEKAAIHNAIQLSDSILARIGLGSYGNVTKLLRGAALVSDIEGFHYLGDDDPFLRVWKEQGPDMVEQINDWYRSRTIQEGRKDFLMGPNYFQTFSPEDGAGRLYDSIMAIGLGACKAERDESGAVGGRAHRGAIESLTFTGATGNVRFGDPRTNATKYNIRQPDTAVFGVFNLYPPSLDKSQPDANKDSSYNEAFVLTETLTGLLGPFIYGHNHSTGIWTPIGPTFVYADGSIEPPQLLRDVPEQNYLTKKLRITGLTVMSVTLLMCAISLVFVLYNWSHRVIRASQPKYLCLVIFGAAVSSLAVLTVSFDESYGWDEEALSKACMATPWLFCCGHIVTYGALFSKLWRVNKVLQFTRRKISAAAVAGPMAALLLATIVVLTAWTIHDPLVWVRTTINEYTGESIAQCDCDSMPIYVPILAVVVAIPTILTCVFAWKTKDVDETFTESAWIFTLIIIQIQVIMVSFPIVVLLRGSSTDGRYIGLVLIMTIFPASTVTLIMCPKFVSYFNQSGSSVATSRNSGVRRSRGSSGGGVRLSGISGLSGASNDFRHHSNMEMRSAAMNRNDDTKRVSFATGTNGESPQVDSATMT